MKNTYLTYLPLYAVPQCFNVAGDKAPNYKLKGMSPLQYQLMPAKQPNGITV